MLMLCDVAGIALLKATHAKIDRNEKRFPCHLYSLSQQPKIAKNDLQNQRLPASMKSFDHL